MRLLLPVFVFAIFLSAGLLFLIQPLAGKILLPLLGGSPAVWNTCMVFFQAMLLLGYGYSHLSTTLLTPRVQAIVHLILLVFVGLTLPIPIEVGEPGDGQTTLWLLKTLALTVGLPFFIVSTTGPLLQRWFSTTLHPQASDPYFLYAASNAGSVVGLLCYPVLLEPFFTRAQQSLTYTFGYALLAPLVIACSFLSMKFALPSARIQPSPPISAIPQATPHALARWRERAAWLFFAFVPSSLMLGVTQYITTDLAPIPLLWIVPLIIYLVTFIITFSPRVRVSAHGWGRVLPIFATAVLVGFLLNANHPMWALASIHLGFFAVAGLMCHKRLAESRPPATRLTEFYLIMSVGGVMGGIFNALIAPVAFTGLFEYPIAIAAALLARPQLTSETPRHSLLLRWALAMLGGLALFIFVLNINAAIEAGRFSALRFPLLTRTPDGNFTFAGISVSLLVLAGIVRAGIPALICLLLLLRKGSARFAVGAIAILTCLSIIGDGANVLYKVRTFFGVHRVSVNDRGTWVKLAHGTTVHGAQSRLAPAPENQLIAPPLLSATERFNLFYRTIRTPQWVDANFNHLPLIPTTYYHPSGPIGEVFRMLTEQSRLKKVALVGMGAGTLAAYATPGARFTFYEIDNAVVHIASPKVPYSRCFFTFVADAIRDPTVQIGVEVGDGRLKLKQTTEGPFDLIVLDAFSSDSIPVHLLTREALQIYLKHLQPNGLLAFHISNRYFDLRDPLARLGESLSLKVFVRNDSVVTNSQRDEGKSESLWVVLAHQSRDFMPLAELPNWERRAADKNFPLWTDDHANVLGALITDTRY